MSKEVSISTEEAGMDAADTSVLKKELGMPTEAESLELLSGAAAGRVVRDGAENDAAESSSSNLSEKGMSPFHDAAGIASRTRSRKRKALSSMAIDEGSPSESKVSVLDYYISDDFEMFKLPPKKRKSAAWIYSAGACRGMINNNNEHHDQGPIPPPDMPDNVKAVIQSLEGTSIMLVVQKRLTATDVSDHQNRLQIPFRQMSDESHNFLTDEEKDFLDNKDEKNRWNHIGTPLLDPGLDSHNVMLRKWVMNKKSGDRTQVYVLNQPWIRIVRKNGLEAGDVIQVWSFRVGGQLRMALVMVDE